jgi:hypothetical protein
MTDAPGRFELAIVDGPIELPLPRYHVAQVGIGAYGATLALRPTDDHHGPRYEVSLHGPFSIAGRGIESPPMLPSSLQALIAIGIVAARTTAEDGLEIELMTGDIVAAGAGSWSLEAPDGRRWEAQPGGGIAVWSAEADDVAVDDRRVETGPGDDADLEGGPTETSVEIGRGLDLPGVGFRLVGLDVQVDGRLSLILRPEGAGSAREAMETFDGPDVMEAFEFFASLNVGPGTVPPDPEVFDAMKTAIERSDFGLAEDVWIGLDVVEPPGPEVAVDALRAMGSSVEKVRVTPGGRLEVEIEGGPRLVSPTWGVHTSTRQRWTGSEGQVVHRVWGQPAPPLSATDARALADAWLDHDRTGRESRQWAWDRVSDVIHHQPMTGWLLTRQLIAGAADEDQLMSVAAGPLEDLLADHSQVLMDRVEAAARSDPRTMRALAGVWKNAIDDDDWARIQRLVGRAQR